jgi:hypothetical protein
MVPVSAGHDAKDEPLRLLHSGRIRSQVHMLLTKALCSMWSILVNKKNGAKD